MVLYQTMSLKFMEMTLIILKKVLRISENEKIEIVNNKNYILVILKSLMIIFWFTILFF